MRWWLRCGAPVVALVSVVAPACTGDSDRYSHPGGGASGGAATGPRADVGGPGASEAGAAPSNATTTSPGAGGSSSDPAHGGAGGTNAGGTAAGTGSITAGASGAVASAGAGGALTSGDAGVTHRPSEDRPRLTCADVTRTGPVGVAACGGLRDWQVPSLSHPDLRDTVTDFATPVPTVTGQPFIPMQAQSHMNVPASWYTLAGGDGYVALIRFQDIVTGPTWQYTLLCLFDDRGGLTRQLADVSTLAGDGGYRKFWVADAASRGGTTAALLMHAEGGPYAIQYPGQTLVANGKRLLDFDQNSELDPEAVPSKSSKFAMDSAMSMALTADGRIVIAATHRFDANDVSNQARWLLLDQDGRVLMDAIPLDGLAPTAIAIGKDDEVLALRSWGNGPDYQQFVDRYDLTFTRLDRWVVPSGVNVRSIDVDARSRVAVAGADDNGAWAEVLRISDWSPVVGPLALKASAAQAVDLTDAGELTLAGGDDSGAPWVMRYDANGTPAWPTPKPLTPSATFGVQTVSLESNGHILTAGTQPLEYCE